MTTQCCPPEVYWKKVHFDPLFGIHFQSIVLSQDDQHTIIVPSHLDQDGIRAFKIYIYLNDMTDIETHLRHSCLSWESIDYSKQNIFGGYIFKRPMCKGYWTLQAPCLECYFYYSKIFDDDIDQLERMTIRASIFCE